MRIVVIGATGTIGRPVADALAGRHEVVRVSLSKADIHVDIASRASIAAMWQAVGSVDAVVSAAGRAAFRALTELTDDDFALGLSNKLMGQINLMRTGLAYVREGGSFTFTSGVLAHEPIPGGAAISLVNAGLEGFVAGAAIEAPRRIRVNVVSPPWVSETLVKMGKDPSGGMPAARVAKAYVQAVEGSMTGAVIDPRKLV